MADSVTLTIDGTSVTVPAGTLLVEAAKAIATDVPVYCYHPKLGPAGLCRICLVDVEKTPKLQIACNTVATEGMVVHTRGDKVESGRKAVMEFLLLNHPLDCPICDKGGECDLQDYSMAYGASASRLADAKASKPKAIDLGPTIVLDDERCIVCQRCTRFDELITHERSLVVKERGQRDVIATASGDPYVSNFSGNVTELCPVGALTSKTYRFKSRPWDNARTQTTCTQCAVGCGVYVDRRYGVVQRTMSVQHDDAASDGWLCDRGRYNIAYLDDARRVTSPLLRRGDEWLQLDWDDAIDLAAEHLRGAIAAGGPGSVAALGGGRLLSEEIVLLERLLRGGLGVENLDWRTGRQRQAHAGATRGTYAQLERADVVLAVGRPPAQLAPVLDLRARKAVIRGGARYVVVGEHPAGSFVPALAVRTLDEALPYLEGARRVAIVWDGVDVALGARLAEQIARLSAAGAEVATYVASEQANALGAESLGLVPRDGGLPAAGVLDLAAAGGLGALLLLGANPVLHHPHGAAAVAAAIGRVPFVIATELFLTESSRLANLVLPVRSSLEKSGHVYDIAGDARLVEAAHAAPEGALADGEIAVALAAALGVEIPSPGDAFALSTRPLAAAGALGEARFADGARRAAPAVSGLRVAVGASIFAGGGTVRHDDRIAALRPVPAATFAPATAARLGIAAGDVVELRAGERVLGALVARIDEAALEDAAAVLDGLSDAPANGFADGEPVTATVAARRAEPSLVGGLS